MLAQKSSAKEQLDEEVLLKELVAGDYRAFTSLYEAYVGEITNYAFRFTSDIQIIEDSLHDIFVWLWNNRTQLGITYSIKAYLFKSVRTSILRKIQKYKKEVLLETVVEKAPVAFFISGEERYIDRESNFILKERINNLLGLLTPKQKEVIYLRFYQGQSFDEIAANMHLSTKACYKLMGRAISELRKTSAAVWRAIIYFYFFFLI